MWLWTSGNFSCSSCIYWPPPPKHLIFLPPPIVSFMPSSGTALCWSLRHHRNAIWWRQESFSSAPDLGLEWGKTVHGNKTFRWQFSGKNTLMITYRNPNGRVLYLYSLILCLCPNSLMILCWITSDTVWIFIWYLTSNNWSTKLLLPSWFPSNIPLTPSDNLLLPF